MIKKSHTGVTSSCFLLLLVILSFSGASDAQHTPLPNILWITSEDNIPMLGCYGDNFATTPHLDKLASGGFLYTHAYAPAAVCSPSRNSLITGVYANSAGNQHMRSEYRKSDLVRLYPEFLRKAGYYCTNNFKEDFNIDPDQTRNTWDELGTKAHYRNRQSGQPFFAIFNTHLTHESSLHIARPKKPLRHRPADVTLPPHHPDTPELREDWAQYYDNVEDMDNWVGSIMKELEDSGDAENTIIFYYSDHAGVLPRSKRFIYESGTHIPFIVYIPEKYRHLWPAAKPGARIDQLISLIDLPPTLLSIIGSAIPEYMQGNAFLGAEKGPEQQYVFHFRDRQEERYDLYRAVRDKRFRYIRNYKPARVYGQHSEYMWLSQAYRSWETACLSGKCNAAQSIFWQSKPIEELYDTENDPWEINNLAGDPRYRAVLERMRKACRDWMIRIKDTGFIHEGDLVGRTGKQAAYDYMRNVDIDVSAIVDAAELASKGSSKHVPTFLRFLRNEEAAVRYWGAVGLAFKTAQEQKQKVIAVLKQHCEDPVPDVAVAVAEALYRLGDTTTSRTILQKALQSDVMAVRLHALNVIDWVNENHPESHDAVIALVRRAPAITRAEPDLRIAKWLFQKWGVDYRSFAPDLDWSWTN